MSVNQGATRHVNCLGTAWDNLIVQMNHYTYHYYKDLTNPDTYPFAIVYQKYAFLIPHSDAGFRSATSLPVTLQCLFIYF